MRKTPSQRARDQAKLDRAVRRATGKEPEELAPQELASARAHLLLDTLYAGQYVVYRDRYEGEGESLRLTGRDVLRHSRSLAVVQRYFDSLPPEEQRTACLSFVDERDQLRMF